MLLVQVINAVRLQVFSTFPRDMPLLRLTTLSHDPRIFFESFDANQPPIIKKGESSYLGRIMFLPAASCLEDCYVGMPLHTTGTVSIIFCLLAFSFYSFTVLLFVAVNFACRIVSIFPNVIFRLIRVSF